MKFFYNILKYIYYILTIFVGIFFLQGELLFGDIYITILEYLVPGYLVISGVMIGLVISTIIASDIQDKAIVQKQEKKYFILGLLLGIVLALAYIFIAS